VVYYWHRDRGLSERDCMNETIVAKGLVKHLAGEFLSVVNRAPEQVYHLA